MAFARFMASPAGRGARMVAGVFLVVVGIAAGGALGVVLSVLGVVAFVAGAANICLIGPLLRAPFRGADVR
jgi:H+/gluconate symporter-like permease